MALAAAAPSGDPVVTVGVVDAEGTGGVGVGEDVGVGEGLDAEVGVGDRRADLARGASSKPSRCSLPPRGTLPEPEGAAMAKAVEVESNDRLDRSLGSATMQRW